jgi:class 3 adenylate cyclase
MILHRKGAPHVTVDQGRYLAEHIQDARFVPLEGTQSTFYEEPNDDVVEHIEEFLSGLGRTIEPDRALAAILYTDIVGSTERLSAMGDREWRNLLDTHDAVARTMVEQHRGKIVKTTGDGILATFDGPGRAILCALALRDAVQPLGLDIRAGLHTGEVEMRGTDIAGIAAHIAARVLEATPPGELLVSGAVPMLVAGSGFEFEDRGEHELKGVPGAWRLYAVDN